MISPVNASLGSGYGELDTRLAVAIHVRFGLPAHIPCRIKSLIKRANNLSV